MRALYEKVSNKLDTVNFEDLWPGFKRYSFALYTGERIYLEKEDLPWDERFIGNTAILYEGSFMAIWRVEGDGVEESSIDVDKLVADMVHEMFHAFQLEQGESRYPNDLVALDYPNNIRNYGLKYAENLLLIQAYKEKKSRERGLLMSQFYSVRSERECIIGNIIEYEYTLETGEGMAEYVGMMALKQLSEVKYRVRLDTYINSLKTYNVLQLNIRRMSYCSGTLLLVVAHELGLPFYHSIKNEKRTLFEILRDALPALQYEEVSYDKRMIEGFIKEDREKKREIIKSFLEKGNTYQLGDYQIIGYDPMNMFKVDDKIYCKTFIRLATMNRHEEEALTWMGETVLEAKEGEVNKIKGFYRPI